MRTRPRILFVFRKDARKVLGEKQPDSPGTITCRITVRGASTIFSTGIRATWGEWSADAHRLRGKSVAIQQANEALTKLEDRLNDLAADLDRQGKPVTANRLLGLYRKDDSSPLSMLELYDAFLAEREKLVGIELSRNSYLLTKHRRTMLGNFLTAQRLADLRPEEFTHNLADKFVHWCLVEHGYKRSYANKALQVFGQCLLWGVRREHLERSPLGYYKYKMPERGEIKYLNVGELANLTTVSLPVDCLRRVRDCFVFQCWTGLAYADLAALNVARDAEYHKDTSGTVRRVLRVRRQKSTMHKGFECIIPLLPEAERILADYSDKLPVPTNQIYNRYLKQVAELCGMETELLTSHVGRKTAGVMMLNLGIRMETVSKFLGHSSVSMTEKVYAKILDTTVVDDFSRLFGGTGPASEPGLEVTPLPTVRGVALLEVSEVAQDATPSLWRRPPPTTSQQVASQQSSHVVPLWSDYTDRKEAACA